MWCTSMSLKRQPSVLGSACSFGVDPGQLSCKVCDGTMPELCLPWKREEEGTVYEGSFLSSALERISFPIPGELIC
jgi:hypothetical protein